MNIEELYKTNKILSELYSLIMFMKIESDDSLLSYTQEYIKFMEKDVDKEITDYKKCNPDYFYHEDFEKIVEDTYVSLPDNLRNDIIISDDSITGQSGCMLIVFLKMLDMLTNDGRNRTGKLRKWLFTITWFLKTYMNKKEENFEEKYVKIINELFSDIEKTI